MLLFSTFTGSPFQIGRGLGQFGAHTVREKLLPSPLWDEVMTWRGTELSMAIQALVRQHHPYIWDELQGLARGIDLPAEDVFLWNCRNDLGLAPCTRGTTILQMTSLGPRISHNQDGPLALLDRCSLVECVVDHAPAFSGLVCPGSLPGQGAAVNEHGLALVLTHARLRDQPAPSGIPTAVLMRELLNQSDLSKAMACLRNNPRMGAFHLSMTQAGTTTLLSIEATPEQLSVETVKTPRLHANHLVHHAFEDIAQDISDASRYRQIQGTALLTQLDAPDALSLLSDQSNQDYPIFRDKPDDPEHENTLATIDMLAQADAVLWDVYTHPKEPAAFRMRNASQQ